MNWYKISQQMEFDFMKQYPYSKMKSDISYPPPNEGDLDCSDIFNEIDECQSYQELFGLLQHCKIDYEIVYFDNLSVLVFEVNGETFVIDDYNSSPFTYQEAKEFINDISFSGDAWKYVDEKDFSSEFWEDVGEGYKLYHGTSEDNLESIKRYGLSPRNETRGISNRGTGSSVFFSPDPETADSYYDVVLEVDIGRMKQDGYMPIVTKEEPVEEKEMLDMIAYKLGLNDFEWDIEQGIDPETVIFHGNIPPKYIRVWQ